MSEDLIQSAYALLKEKVSAGFPITGGELQRYLAMHRGAAKLNPKRKGEKKFHGAPKKRLAS